MKKIIQGPKLNKLQDYLIHNPNTDETYIGSTVNLNRRANEHSSELNNNCHGNYKLQEAYNKDPNFEFIFALGHKHDEATRNKISQSHIGKKLSQEHNEKSTEGRTKDV